MWHMRALPIPKSTASLYSLKRTAAAFTIMKIKAEKANRRMIIMPEKNELDYTCGLSDEEITRRFKEAIRIDEEMRAVQGIPQARYDEEKRLAYLEYADGRKEYVGQTASA